MKNWPIKRLILLAFGLAIGAGTGYAYWYYVGCNSDSCMITSKASNSTLYGLAMGGLLAGTVWDYMKKHQKDKS